MPLDLQHEKKALRKKANLVVGVDEAGRGPIAGPVCCGAFAFIDDLNTDICEYPYSAIGDSKQLAEADRELIYDSLRLLASGAKVGQCATSAPADDGVQDPARADPNNDENIPQKNVPLDENLPPTPSAAALAHIDKQCENGEGAGIAVPEAKLNLEDVQFAAQCPFLFAMCRSEPPEIDTLNILEATLITMSRAVYKLISLLPPGMSELQVKVLVDGNRMPPSLNGAVCGMVAPNWVPVSTWETAVKRVAGFEAETIVKGDSSVFSIAAASIVAKVSRDRLLRELATQYPDYELDIHKGYPTPSHKAKVKKIGPSQIHRLSFEPCYSLLKEKVFSVPSGRDFESIQKLKEAKKTSRGKRAKDAVVVDPAQPKLKLLKRK